MSFTVHLPHVISLDEWDRLSEAEKERELRSGAVLSREDIKRLAERLVSSEVA